MDSMDNSHTVIQFTDADVLLSKWISNAKCNYRSHTHSANNYISSIWLIDLDEFECECECECEFECKFKCECNRVNVLSK